VELGAPLVVLLQSAAVTAAAVGVPLLLSLRATAQVLPAGLARVVGAATVAGVGPVRVGVVPVPVAAVLLLVQEEVREEVRTAFPLGLQQLLGVVVPPVASLLLVDPPAAPLLVPST